MVSGKRPHIVPTQIRNTLVPERPAVDYGRTRRYVGVDPLRCSHRGVRARIDPGESNRIQHRACQQYNHQRDDPRKGPPFNRPAQPGRPHWNIGRPRCGPHRPGDRRCSVPFFRKRSIPHQGIVKQEVIAHGGRSRMPFFRKWCVARRFIRFPER